MSTNLDVNSQKFRGQFQNSEKLNLKRDMSSIKEESDLDNFDCEAPQIPEQNKSSIGRSYVSATETRYPILTKEMYRTYPPLETLQSMTERELSRVENFKVFNQFGSIEWEGYTDLTGVNLDIAVHIRHENAEVYPDDSFRETKPQRGQKLNKTAIITLESMSFGKCTNSQEAMEACVRSCN